MSQLIDTQYGCRFSDCNIITQFFYDGAGIVKPWAQFSNMPPKDFEPATRHYIVAVWHIKPKQLA